MSSGWSSLRVPKSIGWARVCTATLPEQDSKKPAVVEFAFDCACKAPKQLQVVPVGKTSQVSLASNWPHPSFIGTLRLNVR